MTLDDAIKHAEDQSESAGSCPCAEEHRKLAEWLTDLQKLQQHLKEIEWSDDNWYCPACGNKQTIGHKPDCWIAREIGKMEVE